MYKVLGIFFLAQPIPDIYFGRDIFYNLFHPSVAYHPQATPL